MKKVILFALSVCLTISLYSQTETNLDVYVEGFISDGMDKEPVCWKNGKLYHFTNSDSLSNKSYVGMAIEDGEIYSCFRHCNKDRHGYPHGCRACIYKEGQLLYSYDIPSSSYICSMAVLNGNVFCGMKRDGSNGYIAEYSLVKNNRYDERKKDCGEFIISKDGILCYSKNRAYYRGITGYVIGGQEFSLNYKLNNNNETEYKEMRLIDENVCFIGHNTEYPYVDFIQINTGNKILFEKEEYCKDITKAGDKLYVNVSGVIRSLTDKTDVVPLPSEYSPIRIVGKNNNLYILCSKKEGALNKYFVFLYNVSAKNISSYKLNGCSDAFDLIIVEK